VVGGTIFWGGGGAAMGFGNGVWQWWGQRCIRSSVGPVWVGRGAKEMSLARCEFSATWVGIISSMQHVVLVFVTLWSRCKTMLQKKRCRGRRRACVAWYLVKALLVRHT
jgi:hypothetical protein